MMNKRLIFNGCWAILFTALAGHAQPGTPVIDAAEKQAVIDSIGKLLTANYVFPEKAKEMQGLIHQNLEAGQYDALDDPNQFASRLTEDLQSVSHDLHLRVRYNPRMIAEMNMTQTPEDSLQFIQLMEKRSAEDNYGFEEVKMLSHGVGYLKFNGFSGSPNAGKAAEAAMNFLANSEALIIDLRQNGGGSPDMIQILSSYLYNGDRVHLNDFYYRPENTTEQRWTLPYVPGKRLGDADVYVLTSNRTFSAAEEFTYNLKNLKRATIVGETTGGGAHPGGVIPASDKFGIFVPSGRAINPITHTNWEGTGVEPDVKVSSNDALKEAHYRAVNALAVKHQDDPDNPYAWTRDQLNVEAHPVTLSTAEMQTYTGTFGPRVISLEDGHLYYRRDQGAKNPMVFMGEDRFMFEEIPYFRLHFIRNGQMIVAVEGEYDDGHTDRNEKTIKP
ncbi:MAG: S41 family peptidase [Saprospiraceae bacterium]|nr:S41 family peptidase [Saprospiraceae bacterium]